MNSGNGFTGPINIGNPEEFSILELASLILEITSSKSKLIFLPLPQDDPMQRKPIIELAKNELNWEPKVKLKAGLVTTIEYFDKFLSN
jgi:UDP-glucuronate decarboxylase